MSPPAFAEQSAQGFLGLPSAGPAMLGRRFLVRPAEKREPQGLMVDLVGEVATHQWQGADGDSGEAAPKKTPKEKKKDKAPQTTPFRRY